jgi:predicted alpha/beta superfamily hydrolase
MKIILTILLSMILSASAASGQVRAGTKPFVLGITDSFRSAQLGETRVLNIYLPDGYDTATAKFPVIYLLDGSANEDFIHIVGLVQFLNMIQVLPATIVVGVANVDRRRDFTFPTKVQKDLAAYPTTGGSARFIAFVEKELQPYVEHHYRVSAQKTIIGQSLGGLLATEILLKKPALFTNYIIVSPSLWWNNESLLDAAPGLLKKGLPDGIKVYISAGSEGEQMKKDVENLVGLLPKNAATTELIYYPMPEESHLTILHRSVYKALELLSKKPER